MEAGRSLSDQGKGQPQPARMQVYLAQLLQAGFGDVVYHESELLLAALVATQDLRAGERNKRLSCCKEGGCVSKGRVDFVKHRDTTG